MLFAKLFFLATCFLATCFFVNAKAEAQVLVGNGGDIISCRPSAENSFDGYYFLDYVATWDSLSGRDAFHDVANPVEHIITLLQERFPALGLNLREFVDEANRQIPGQPDHTSRFIWLRTSNGLLELGDEQLSFLPESFPDNCFEPADPGSRRTLKLLQVIIHENRGQARIYKFDNRYAALITHDPLQYSMMLVHEWLWQFSPNATVTRDANRFLHTKALEGTDYRTLKLALENIGLDLSTLPPPRVEVLLSKENVERGEVKRMILDREYGVDLRLINADDGFYAVQIVSNGTQLLYLKPRRLGGGPQAQIRVQKAADVLVAVCHPESQQCDRPAKLAEIFEP